MDEGVTHAVCKAIKVAVLWFFPLAKRLGCFIILTAVAATLSPRSFSLTVRAGRDISGVHEMFNQRLGEVADS